MKKPRQWGQGEFFHPRRGHGHHNHHGSHGHHGWWGKPEHKEARRTWKLSKIFGGEPLNYKDFVLSTLELDCEAVIKKYAEDNKVQLQPLSE